MVPPPVKVRMQMLLHVWMRILTSVVMFYKTLHAEICGCGYGCGPVYVSHKTYKELENHSVIYRVTALSFDKLPVLKNMAFIQALLSKLERTYFIGRN